MQAHLESLLQDVAPYLDRRLTSGTDLHALRSVVRQVQLGRQLLCEVELAAHTPRTGVSVGFLGAPDERQALLRLAAAQHGSAAWNSVRVLAASWCDPRSTVGHAVSQIGLEFDGAQAAGDAPEPSVFLALCRRETAVAPSWSAVVQDVLPRLGIMADSEALARIARGCDVFERHAECLFVGIWLARKTTSVRLVPTACRGQGPGRMLRMLAAAGWCGPKGAWVDEWCPLLQRHLAVRPAVDVGIRVAPSLTLELAMTQRLDWEPMRAAWGDLLLRFEKQGWCRPERREAVLQWIGGGRVAASPGRDVAATPDDGSEYIHLRTMSHAKLAFSPEENAPCAKAYLLASRVRVARDDRSAADHRQGTVLAAGSTDIRAAR